MTESKPRQDILVWCDIETMNLPPKAPMLELGFLVTDLDGNKIDSQSWLIWDDFYMNYWEEDTSDFVINMHTKNDLFTEARDLGSKRAKVEKYAVDWLRSHGYQDQPMCGSSLNADKGWLAAQMPSVLDVFHYRIIDCSSLKEMCRRYNPNVYKALPEKRELHRVDPDLEDSVAEFKHYLDNFIWDGRP